MINEVTVTVWLEILIFFEHGIQILPSDLSFSINQTFFFLGTLRGCFFYWFSTTGGGMGALRRYISAVGSSLWSSRSSRSGSSQSNDSSPNDSENERRESRVKRLKRSVTKDILWSPWRDFSAPGLWEWRDSCSLGPPAKQKVWCEDREYAWFLWFYSLLSCCQRWAVK